MILLRWIGINSKEKIDALDDGCKGPEAGIHHSILVIFAGKLVHLKKYIQEMIVLMYDGLHRCFVLDAGIKSDQYVKKWIG